MQLPTDWSGMISSQGLGPRSAFKGGVMQPRGQGAHEMDRTSGFRFDLAWDSVGSPGLGRRGPCRSTEEAHQFDIKEVDLPKSALARWRGDNKPDTSVVNPGTVYNGLLGNGWIRCLIQHEKHREKNKNKKETCVGAGRTRELLRECCVLVILKRRFCSVSSSEFIFQTQAQS